MDDRKYRAKGLDDLKYRAKGTSSIFVPFIKNELRWISIAKEIIKDPEASPYWPPTLESVNELVEFIRKYEGIKRVEKVVERAIARVNGSG